MLTQERLKELMHYDPFTGYFTWLRCRAGKRAGTARKLCGEDSYIQICLEGQLYYAHRLAFLYMEGIFPVNEVDHINHDYTDNRWSNLRLATRRENNKNSSKRRDNQTGVTGVNWNSGKSLYQARVHTASNKQQHLGWFRDFFEACCARKAAELKYGYHENHGTERLL